MSKLSNPTRVTKENVPKEYQDIVESVGGPYNAFSDEVYYALNGNITIADNLNMRYKVIDLSVNGSGTPLISTQFKNTLNNRTRYSIKCRIFRHPSRIFSKS